MRTIVIRSGFRDDRQRHVLMAGHAVVAMVVLGGGERAVSATYDGALDLWDLAGGSRIRTIHRSNVHVLEGQPVVRNLLAPDDTHILAAERDRLLFIDLQSDTIVTHDLAVTAMTIVSPGRALLVHAEGSFASRIVFFDGGRLDPGPQWRGPYSVSRVIASTEHDRFATCTRDGTIQLWRLATGSEVASCDHNRSFEFAAIPGTQPPVIMAADRVVAGIGLTIFCWSAADGQLLWTKEVPRTRPEEFPLEAIVDVCASPDGTWLVAATEDRNVTTFRLTDSGTTHSRVPNAAGPIGFTPDCSTVLVPGPQLVGRPVPIRVLDLRTGNQSFEFARHTRTITHISTLDSGRRAVSASSDGTIRVWDLKPPTRSAPSGHRGVVTRMRMTPDSRRLITCSADGSLCVWDNHTGTELRRFHCDGVPGSLAISPDATQVASSTSTTILVWSLESRLDGHSGTVTALGFLPDNKRLLSGSMDQTLKTWDLDTCSELMTLRGHKDGIHTLVLTHDGKRALSGAGYDDQTIKLWDLDTGIEMFTFEGHTEGIVAALMLGSSDQAVSVADGHYDDYDDKLRIWGLKAGRLIAVLEEEDLSTTTGFSALAVTPDGRFALTGHNTIHEHDETTVRLWDLSAHRSVRISRSRLLTFSISAVSCSIQASRTAPSSQ